jgi:hypothetical protein
MGQKDNGQNKRIKNNEYTYNKYIKGKWEIKFKVLKNITY